MLRSETLQSESDNDSLCTPHNSPKRKFGNNNFDENNRLSFGLHSPDENAAREEDFKAYLQRIRELRNVDAKQTNGVGNLMDLYVFDPDIIDLTLIPPPATPDELDSIPPTPINVPPLNFADSVEKLNKLGIVDEELDLEEFLASVTIPPPTQKVTPVVELTPEEIMSYIIPPPPQSDCNLGVGERKSESLPADLQNGGSNGHNKDVTRRDSTHSNIIEYATVDRKGEGLFRKVQFVY